jgi:hypothetical protein
MAEEEKKKKGVTKSKDRLLPGDLSAGGGAVFGKSLLRDKRYLKIATRNHRQNRVLDPLWDSGTSRFRRECGYADSGAE